MDMVRLGSLCALLSAALLLGGCTDIWGAHMRTVHRVDKISDDSIIFTDAKQNATFARFDGVRLRACAARSPDVFSVLSAAASGSFSFEEAQRLSAAASGQGATGESGSAFGLRTQLTQTQLELLYRLCEAELNGALAPGDYEKQMRRFQNTMVAMLAIEQLTGYARPTVAQNTSNAGFAPAGNEAELKERLKTLETREGQQQTAADTAAGQLATAQQNFLTAQADADANPGDAAKQTTAANAKKTRDEASDKFDIAAKRLADTQNEMEQINQALATGVPVTAGDSSVTQPSEPSGATQAVATAVTNIVNTALHQTETTEECLKYVFQQAQPGSTSATDERMAFCIAHLQEVNAQKRDELYLIYGCERVGPNSPVPLAAGQERWSCPERITPPGPLAVDPNKVYQSPTAKTMPPPPPQTKDDPDDDQGTDQG
jgi:hypothetical protein